MAEGGARPAFSPIAVVILGVALLAAAYAAWQAWAQSEAVEELRAAYRDHQLALGAYYERADAQKATLSLLEETIEALAAEFGTRSDELAAARERVDALSDRLEALERGGAE